LVDLTTKIASLTLKNPTILASGLMDEDAGSMKRIISCGAEQVFCNKIKNRSTDIKPNFYR
jgi:dihydroorotate dehydrogenase